MPETQRPAPDPDASQDPTTLHVRRARQGDPGSLEWVIRRFHPVLVTAAEYRLGRVLRRHTGPEDLVQETWAIALPRLASIGSDAGRATPVLLRFLTSTMLNLVRDLARRHATRRRENPPEADGAGSSAAGASAVAAEITGMITRIARGETQAAVRAALDALSPDDRALLVLRGLEGHSYAEIAPILGASPDALMTRWTRALRRLKSELPESIFAEFDPD